MAATFSNAAMAAHSSTPNSADNYSSLRIVHLLSTLNVGGMEQFVLRIAAEQIQTGHESSIIALRGGPLAEQAALLRVRTNVLSNRIPAGRAIQMLARILRARPHILHVHNLAPIPYSVIAKRLTGARIVMTRHGQNPNLRPTPSQARKIDSIVAVSEAAASVLRSYADSKTARIETIHNGVAFAKARNQRRLMRERFGFRDEVVGIIVARIDHQKGHESLLRATARAVESNPRIRILIVGDGPKRRDMEELSQNLGLSGIAIFTGFSSDVPDLLGASDFFCLPSLSEGLPLSLLEAMSHGLPSIVTPVGGMPEAISDGMNGLVVPLDESNALAEAMLRLAESKDFRMALGDAARARVESDFSFKTMTANYESLYRKLLARNESI